MARFLSHWRGVLLSLVGIVAIAWLALTNQLGLYIHPRYFVFTMIMAGAAAVFVILAFALLPGDVTEPHEHDTPSRRDRGAWWWIGVSGVLLVVTACGLLVLPPATLTTSTVEQRDINGSASPSLQGESVNLVGGDDSAFTIKDWVGLLRQGADEDTLTGRTPTLVGFVTPDSEDPENVFYVARFVITCCAVDAQPIGVPVYLPGWQDQFTVDEWVSVTGAFVANPSIDSLQAVALSPSDIVTTEQPTQPYVY